MNNYVICSCIHVVSPLQVLQVKKRENAVKGLDMWSDIQWTLQQMYTRRDKTCWNGRRGWKAVINSDGGNL